MGDREPEVWELDPLPDSWTEAAVRRRPAHPSAESEGQPVEWARFAPGARFALLIQALDDWYAWAMAGVDRPQSRTMLTLAGLTASRSTYEYCRRTGRTPSNVDQAAYLAVRRSIRPAVLAIDLTREELES